ncbi:unnamed protein product [Symbiodinium sp. CCMP2592]|nr:unnamed protein product [Symbiodinium sp. CCMP2592]
MGVRNWQVSFDQPGEHHAIAPSKDLFIPAMGNMLVKIAGAISHGLLAIRWLLAGDPAGPPLIACFLLVANNTQLLTSTSLISHVKAILVSIAMEKGIYIKFAEVKNLWGAPAGKACLLINAISILILLPYLQSRPEDLLLWLGTCATFLLWANSSIKSVGTSVGLMDHDAWQDVGEVLEKHSENGKIMTAPEFLAQLSICRGEEATDGDSKQPGLLPEVLDLMLLKFTPSEELLLRHRRELMAHAFPLFPRLRVFHALAVVCLLLLSSAVPLGMVVFCYSRKPALQYASASDGELEPKLPPSTGSDFYIQPHVWAGTLDLRFEHEASLASRSEFCCSPESCSEPSRRPRGAWTVLETRLPPENFGKACTLHLRGFTERKYVFMVPALRHLRGLVYGTESNPPPSVECSVFDRSCTLSTIRMPQLHQGLQLSLELQLEEDIFKFSYEAKVCRDGARDEDCESADAQRAGHEVWIQPEVDDTTQQLWMQVKITVTPGNLKEPGRLLQRVYAVDARVITNERKYFEIMQTISQARGVVPLELKRNQASLLREVYQQKKEKPFIPLTFLAVGTTGVGKSQLCSWMTDKSSECKPKASMESVTQKAAEVEGFAFGDPKSGYRIQWIDTPGKGDTGGAGKDATLWEDTMKFLLYKRIHRIVWVLNAAWIRGTTSTVDMWTALRRSFGIHLYRRMVIVFNFMPLTGNTTADNEDKLNKTQALANWMLEQENKTYHWRADAMDYIAKLIRAVKTYMVDVNPKHKEDLPSGVPLSAPFVGKYPPFSAPAGIGELMQLLADTARHGGFQVGISHPPIGPGQADRLTVVRSKCVWDIEEDCHLVPATVANTTFAGHLLSRDDAAFPFHGQRESACGVKDTDAQGWASWMQRIRNPAMVAEDRTFARFTFRLKHNDNHFCYCEAPDCAKNVSWRYDQKPAIAEKDFARQKCLPQYVHVGDGNWHMSLIGGKLLGVPEDEKQPPRLLLVNPKDLGQGGIQPAMQGVCHKPRGWWCRTKAYGWSQLVAAHDGRVAYALPSRGQHILVVNLTTSTPLQWTIQTRFWGKIWPGPLELGGIVATSTRLYLIPGRGHEFRSLDLHKTNTNPKLWKVSGHLPELQVQTMKWSFALIVNDKLFTCPFNVQVMLVIDIFESSVVQRIETWKVFNGGEAWKSLLAHDGHIYASPFNANKMLVVDAHRHGQDSIDVRRVASGQRKWNGMAQKGGVIFAAPVDAPAILVLDTASRSVWGLPVARRRGSEGAFNTITAVGNRLILCPASRRDLLVLDHVDQITEAIRASRESARYTSCSARVASFKF